MRLSLDLREVSPKGNAERLRALLARLHRVPELAEPNDEGPCEECDKPGLRWQYGRFLVCSRCALRRRKLAEAQR